MLWGLLFLLAAVAARPASRWLRAPPGSSTAAGPRALVAPAAPSASAAAARSAQVQRLGRALEVLVGAAAQEPLQLRVAAVFDGDGNPIRGVKVLALADSAPAPAALAWSDDEGLVSLRVPPGEYTVVCMAPGLETWHEAIALESDAEIVAVMRPSAPREATILTQDGFAIDR